MTRLCNYLFDTDRAWRTCMWLLPFAYVFGCWAAEFFGGMP